MNYSKVVEERPAALVLRNSIDPHVITCFHTHWESIQADRRITISSPRRLDTRAGSKSAPYRSRSGPNVALVTRSSHFSRPLIRWFSYSTNHGALRCIVAQIPDTRLMQ